MNRPKALNALNLPMIQSMAAAYEAAVANPSVHCVVLEGAGGKAFCAGGDVKGIWEAARSGEPIQKTDVADAFFREEYILNAAIACSPKPQISVWDGIVMGGGVGVSIHGAYRVATENAMFAMPETNIGLFPDVGGSYFLSRLPGELGTYIGLTGDRLHAADLLYAGLATHYTPSEAVPALKAKLESCRSVADVAAMLSELADSPDAKIAAQGSLLEANRAAIDAAFAYDSMEEIVAHLAKVAEGGDEFAAKALKTLQRMSPTSMKVTLRLLREARTTGGAAPLSTCLQREFRVVQRCVTVPSDFFEGIRAALVDKDRNPKWEPSTLEGVSTSAVDDYFSALGDREWLTPPPLPAGFVTPP